MKNLPDREEIPKIPKKNRIPHTIEAVMNSFSEIEFTKLSEMKEFVKKVEDLSLDFATHIAKPAPKAETRYLQKDILTADGTSYQKEFDKISLYFVSSVSFSSKLTISHNEVDIDLGPKLYLNLEKDINMKMLEFKAIRVLLKELIDLESPPHLVLFDGSFLLPDREILSTGNENLVDIGKNYNREASRLFKLLKEKEIPIIGVTKDTSSSLYLNALKKNVMVAKKSDQLTKLLELENNQVRNPSFEEILSKATEKKLLRHESYLIEYMLSSVFLPPSRTIYTRLNNHWRAPPLIDIFNPDGENEGLYGFYIKTTQQSKVFFLQVPEYCLNQLEDILRHYVTLCTYSLRPGYPNALFVAHRLANQNQKQMNNYLRLIKLMARNKIGFESYVKLFREEFHSFL